VRSKGGLIRLTERWPGSAANINVSISPGPRLPSPASKASPRFRAGMSEEDAVEELRQSGRYPAIGALGRPGRPRSTAAAHSASARADFITGPGDQRLRRQ
jgi:hypothetical protein